MPPKPMLEDNSYGDISTPDGVFDFLEPWIPLESILEQYYFSKPTRIWEPCPGEGKLSAYIQGKGFSVIKSTGDFLTRYYPHIIAATDIIVTNPPFKLKAPMIARCVEIGKPWALLLPVSSLGARNVQVALMDVQSEIEIIYLPKRIDFTGGGAPWFACMWLTWGLNIGQQVVFYESV